MLTHAINRTEFGKKETKNRVFTREEANAILFDWVKNERLQLHSKQVACLMKAWAKEKEQLDEAGQWKWEFIT